MRTPRPPGKWLPLLATCLGTFLLLVYATIVTVALPSIAADLHAGFGPLQWVVDVYTLALAGCCSAWAPSATAWAANASTYTVWPLSRSPRSPAVWSPTPRC
ncbi:hypothetical protein JCM4914_48880 [Streptomyces platensis subsp. malvinus]